MMSRELSTTSLCSAAMRRSSPWDLAQVADDDRNQVQGEHGAGEKEL